MSRWEDDRTTSAKLTLDTSHAVCYNPSSPCSVNSAVALCLEIVFEGKESKGRSSLRVVRSYADVCFDIVMSIAPESSTTYIFQLLPKMKKSQFFQKMGGKPAHKTQTWLVCNIVNLEKKSVMRYKAAFGINKHKSKTNERGNGIDDDRPNKKRRIITPVLNTCQTPEVPQVFPIPIIPPAPVSVQQNLKFHFRTNGVHEGKQENMTAHSAKADISSQIRVQKTNRGALPPSSSPSQNGQSNNSSTRPNLLPNPYFEVPIPVRQSEGLTAADILAFQTPQDFRPQQSPLPQTSYCTDIFVQTQVCSTENQFSPIPNQTQVPIQNHPHVPLQNQQHVPIQNQPLENPLQNPIQNRPQIPVQNVVQSPAQNQIPVRVSEPQEQYCLRILENPSCLHHKMANISILMITSFLSERGISNGNFVRIELHNMLITAFLLTSNHFCINPNILEQHPNSVIVSVEDFPPGNYAFSVLFLATNQRVNAHWNKIGCAEVMSCPMRAGGGTSGASSSSGGGAGGGTGGTGGSEGGGNGGGNSGGHGSGSSSFGGGQDQGNNGYNDFDIDMFFDPDFFGSLHYFCYTRDFPKVKHFVENLLGDLYEVDKHGRTALIYAIWSRDIEILRYILQKVPGIHLILTSDKTSCLQIAAVIGTPEIVRELISPPVEGKVSSFFREIMIQKTFQLIFSENDLESPKDLAIKYDRLENSKILEEYEVFSSSFNLNFLCSHDFY